MHVSGQTADVLCAGHPQPLLVRAGAVRAVGHFGPMLGAWPDSRWRTESVALERGDVLVLYTDGVTDTRGADGRFGDARLLDTLRGVHRTRRARWRRSTARSTPSKLARRPTIRPCSRSTYRNWSLTGALGGEH